MAEILKFPTQASKLGFKRVRRRVKIAEHPDQLNLFETPTAQILRFTAGLTSFEHALMLDERGDVAAADLYAKAIEEQDCIADAYCNLGVIESQKGNRIRAFDCFTTSLKHDARHSEAHYNLGNLYFDANDFHLAQTHYEMATQVEPSFANAYFNLALIQAINNDFTSAVIALSKYQGLVSEPEGRIAAELLQNLKQSLSAARNSLSGSSGP